MGVEYTGAEEWKYVCGEAASKPGCTPGTRDAQHDGRSAAEFLEAANAHIRSRKADATAAELLTLDNVLAVRLYTGPAFTPINGWLREVAKLPEEPPPWMWPRWGAWTDRRAAMWAVTGRREAALDSGTSFGATVGELIAAVRKLSSANLPEENRRPLFRGLKGVLQGRFWLPDALDVVCATDSAFMSTSLGEETPIHYMEGGGKPNVLWELESAAADDSGYHCGADVAFLSQFAQEREVLFPPLTMLRVRSRRPALAAAVAGLAPGASAEAAVAHSKTMLQVTTEQSADGKLFERVVVLPLFTG